MVLQRVRGIVSSISLENRFRIQPDGVVSKNDIGSRRMFTSRRLWITVETNTPPRARKYDPNSARIICLIPNTAYTPKYSPLYFGRQASKHNKSNLENFTHMHNIHIYTYISKIKRQEHSYCSFIGHSYI